MTETICKYADTWRQVEDFYAECKRVLHEFLAKGVAIRRCYGCDCGRCDGDEYEASIPNRYKQADIEALYEVAAGRGMLGTLTKAWEDVDRERLEAERRRNMD